MMPAPTTPPSRIRMSPALIGLGVLVIVIGFGLPQLAPVTSSVPDPVPHDSAPATAQTPAPPSAPALGGALLRLVGGLVIVCALCVVVTRYLARQPELPAGTMVILASLPVGPRCAVHLVRAGERRLLIGTDPSGVKSLVELPGREVEPEPSEPTESAAAETQPLEEPASPPSRDEIIALLTRLRIGAPVGASSPG